MLDQIAKYTSKLVTDRSASPDRLAIAVNDDALLSHGAPSLALLAEQVLSHLNAIALVAGQRFFELHLNVMWDGLDSMWV